MKALNFDDLPISSKEPSLVNLLMDARKILMEAKQGGNPYPKIFALASELELFDEVVKQEFEQALSRVFGAKVKITIAQDADKSCKYLSFNLS